MVKNCTFGEAIECIKLGGVASREGWLASQADILSEDWCIRHLKETV